MATEGPIKRNKTSEEAQWRRVKEEVKTGVREMSEMQRAGLRGEHVLATSALPWIRREKDGKRDGWALIAFSAARTRFVNPMLPFGSGQQIEGEAWSRDEE